ncbi:hypothetical protein BKA70DRAFT_1447970 [Coprinopsis sp. MPI-PUGE-AT-0042]|nr:hypothetical protein BKA70DRAFT_1447970 [Coprinopsis sp. MPI-PUGE-AT-0042]
MAVEMVLGFYEQQLGLLAIQGHIEGEESPSTELHTLARKYTLSSMPWPLGADWLQGPYVYSLFSEQYGYPDSTVAILFVTGFLSAALAAPL